MICCCCGPEPKSVVEMSVKDTHINKYQEVSTYTYLFNYYKEITLIHYLLL